ncbi:MAG TPA: HigA family addiction module antitoxin [Thermoanaerobaculia bacterium]|nr:HigA family addiction module antitoxin [Thermoanaerobaculia bacterium]
MLPENRLPTHPGEILRDQFLEPLGLTQVALAEHLGVPVQRINEIVRGKRGVTPETAWLLAQASTRPRSSGSTSKRTTTSSPIGPRDRFLR